MPELVPEGPRIPVHLMNEVDEGSVVFFCGAGVQARILPLARQPINRDHVPSKSLLSKKLRKKGARYARDRDQPDGYLPQVVICKRCNSGFSSDETYLLCVLHAVLAGSLYPDPNTHPETERPSRTSESASTSGRK